MTGARGEVLLQRVGGSMFWNATLIPVVALLNLAGSIIIRRTYGLDAGAYDIAIGLTTTALIYSSMGIPNTFTKLIPDLQRTAGRAAAAAFTLRASLIRMAPLAAVLIAANLMGARLASRFQLGEDSSYYLQAITLLVVGRAIIDLSNRALQACLAHRVANLLLLLQATSFLAAAILVIHFGYGVSGIVLIAGMVAVAVSGLSAIQARRALVHDEHLDDAGHAVAATRRDLPAGRFWRFALFLYAIDLSAYFAGPGFASPVLGVVGNGVGAAAIFNTGYQIPQMLTVLLLSSLQGLYRPLFARLLTQPRRLRTSYREIAKVQAAILIPAGTGLVIMLGDYVPLIYSETYRPSISIARILTVALFLEAFLRLGSLLLSTAEMARPVLAAQSLILIGAFFFVRAASTGNLVLAAFIFPLGRLLAGLVSHMIARRRFGVSLPWTFVLRAMASSLAMSLVLLPARKLWATGWVEAVVLTATGMLVVLLCTRLFGVLGPRELDLLRRAQVPGHRLLLRWLDPSGPVLPTPPDRR